MKTLLPYFDSYETILWDWNGTLLNDAEMAQDITLQQLQREGLKELPREELQKQFCLPIINYYRRLGFNVEGDAFNKLAQYFVTTYEARYHELSLFKGTIELLESLSDRRQFIISAADEKHLKEIVKQHDIHNFFTGVYGIENTHGACKKDRCMDLMADFSLDPKKTLLVGDSTHDAEVAQEAGVDILLIADGFNHHTTLQALGVPVIKSRFSLS